MLNKILICFLGLFITQSVLSDTLLVPQEYKLIEMALNEANDGDTIQLAAGTFYEALTMPDKAITLKGTTDADGSLLTHLGPAFGSGSDYANPVMTFFYLSSQITVKDLKITGLADNLNTSTQGGGMYIVGSEVTVENCHFYLCQATNTGGAVYCRVDSSSAIPSFSDCIFVTCPPKTSPLLMR